MQVKVTFDSHDIKGLRNFPRSQIPFAAAKALTLTAKEAQRGVQANLPKKFIIRRKWVTQGIKIQPAQKRDWPDISATVGSIDPQMVEHEEGGTRSRPKKGRRFALPSAIRRSKRTAIPVSKQPGKILAGSSTNLPYRNKRGKLGARSELKPFIAVTKSGRTGIYIRSGKYGTTTNSDTKRKTRRERLKLLYRLSAKPTHIPKNEWLVKTVSNIAQNKLPKEFEKALMGAIKTMK